MLVRQLLSGSYPQWMHASMLAALAAAFHFMPASAQEIEADLSAYCISSYGVGTISGFDRRDNGPLCTERTHQGLGLLHHKIDPVAVCSAQHNTSRYRKEGPRIICLSGETTTDPNRKIDLADYCRRSYGRSAVVSQRLSDNAPLCTVKGDGGLSQTHYAIDLAQLCGMSGPVRPTAVTGEVLDCAKASVRAGHSDQSDQEGRQGKSHSGAPGTKSDVEPKRRRTQDEGREGDGVPETAFLNKSDNPDLTGCGGTLADLQAAPWVQDSARRWQNHSFLRFAWNVMRFGAMEMPCPGLTGGLKVDLREFCPRFHSDTDVALRWLDSGRPVCAYPHSPLVEGDYWEQGGGLDLWAACTDGFPGEYPRDGSMMVITKFSNRSLECFYLDVSPGAELKLVERTDGVFREVGDQLEFYGGPFFYQVRFDERRDEESFVVRVDIGAEPGNETLDIELTRAEEDDLLYRSEEFFIMPPSHYGVPAEAGWRLETEPAVRP